MSSIQTIASNLRAERARLGLSQQELAEKTGLSAQTIGRIEQATASPTLRTIDRIAHVLGIPSQRLLSAA